MRITLVEFNPASGLFHFAFQLGASLAGRGHEVQLVTGPDPELTSSDPNFELVSILPTWRPGTDGERPLLRKARRLSRGGRHAAAWGVVARHLHSTRPDVVQWASWRFAIDGFMAGWIARQGWCKVSVDLSHSPIPLQEQRISASPYRRGAVLNRGLASGYRAMDTVLVLGHTSRDDLIRTWPGLSRCDVVAHGDEGALGSVEHLPRPSACPPRALLFGTLTRYKGIDLLLDAWPMVREVVTNAQLVIAGGPVGDLDLRDLRRRAAQSEGVSLRVGYLPIPAIAPLVGSARLFVAPYHRSNASGTVRLAQTLGRPVIVTDVGDLAESVVDGQSGLVIPPNDPHALAHGLIRLLQDPALADRLGEAGRSHLMATASWSLVAADVERIYQELLSGSTTG